MRGFTTNGSASTNGGTEGNARMDRSVVLVTGANRGIGQASATLLVEHGYTVLGTARRGPSGESAHGFELLQLDVTSQKSVNSCVSIALERAGRIDVLVNNAGVGLARREQPPRRRWVVRVAAAHSIATQELGHGAGVLSEAFFDGTVWATPIRSVETAAAVPARLALRADEQTPAPGP